MNKAQRRVVIAGNWKMNKTVSESADLIAALLPRIPNADCDVVLCVPYTSLPAAVSLCGGVSVAVGAQNCHFEQSGAYTGEISAPMLRELGVTYAIVGHSERRQYFGETDETVNRRARAVVDAGLTAIICVGELLQDREQGVTFEVVGMQLKRALHGMSESDLARVIIAYEPVWAIGTGKTASAQDADEVCGFIRATVASLYTQAVADRLTIQYGGSMNAQNAAELLAQPHIDGGLIGGASLKPDDFAHIVAAAR